MKSRIKNISTSLSIMAKLMILLITVIFVGTPAYSKDGSEKAMKLESGKTAIVPVSEKGVKTKKGVLLFFLNPNGRPCKMQARILNENIVEIEKRVQIQAISTTVSSHRPYFYQFGVRQLPFLILLDSAGNTVKRFSPGIHLKETVLAALKLLDKQ